MGEAALKPVPQAGQTSWGLPPLLEFGACAWMVKGVGANRRPSLGSRASLGRHLPIHLPEGHVEAGAHRAVRVLGKVHGDWMLEEVRPQVAATVWSGSRGVRVSPEG